MAKPPPYPPKAMGPRKPMRPKPKATPMGKMIAIGKGKKVDPMDYVRPKPKKTGGKFLSPPMRKKRTGKTTVPKKMGY